MIQKYELTPRLEMCAKFAEGSKLLADVGTDHAYLPINLLMHGKIDFAVAADLRQGPLQSARRHAMEAGCADKIRFELADGLDFPGAVDCDAVVCAGMGGETIAGILERAPWTLSDTKLILQPQSKLDELCLWLCNNGYGIHTASLAAEGERMYVCLEVYGGAAGFLYAEDALAAAQDKLLGAWIESRTRRIERALEGMLRGSDTAGEAQAARETLLRLSKYAGGKHDNC